MREVGALNGFFAITIVAPNDFPALLHIMIRYGIPNRNVKKKMSMKFGHLKVLICL